MRARYLQSVVVLLLLCTPTMALAAGPLLRQYYPRLGEFLDAFDVAEAAVFEELVIIRDQPTATLGLEQLLEALSKLEDKTTAHSLGSEGHLSMVGPLRIFETRATPGLVAMIRDEYDPAQAAEALQRVGLLTPRAVAVLRRGRQFQFDLYELLLDDGIGDKRAAVRAAVADYLADSENSVPAEAKDSKLMTEHKYGYSFRVGFPQLAGVLWSTKWLQVAALEPMVTATSVEERDAGIATTMERLQDKLIQFHGMMGLPSELPTVPVVAPLMYNRHPEASRILDNLSMLEIVLADLLTHPVIEDREAAMDEVVVKFTDKQGNLMSERDYLLFALRGGIYNQGGPALGGMAQSERNRSREDLEHNSHNSMPTYNLQPR